MFGEVLEKSTATKKSRAYQPLLQEEHGHNLGEEPRPGRHLWIAWVFHCVAFLTYTVMFLAVMSKARHSVTNLPSIFGNSELLSRRFQYRLQILNQESAFVRDALVLEQRLFDDYIISNNVFRGKPQPELEGAWTQLFVGWCSGARELTVSGGGNLNSKVRLKKVMARPVVDRELFGV